MFSTILLPLDGSETAAQAVPVAKEMARRFEARIHLVQVVDTTAASLALGANAAAGGVSDPAAITGEVNDQVTLAKAYLGAVAEELANDGVQATYEIQDGPAVDGIVEAAANAGADLIVLCSHGRTGLRRLVFGSVARDVARASSVPVLVVRAA
jgi:nucleotide-binding universal stress UspA family protein